MNLLSKKRRNSLKSFSAPWFSAIFLLFLACGQGSNNSSSSSAVYTSEDAMELEETIVRTAKIQADENTDIQQKIIKNGYLEFQTNDLAQTYNTIQQLLDKYEGYIQNDESGKSYNRQFRNLNVRIPSKNFQLLVDDISEDVSFFDNKSISSRDVTEEFIDLAARLKAKRELEARYLQLLDRANSVKEILEIERELTNIREEIESKQGRLEYLQNQVSYSTLNINFYKNISESGITTSYGSKIINALKSGWYGISAVFIGILTLWPLVIIGILVIIAVRYWLKKSKK